MVIGNEKGYIGPDHKNIPVGKVYKQKHPVNKGISKGDQCIKASPLKRIQKILENSSRLLNINIKPAALKMISASSRATPRIANRILKRVRDFAEVKGKNLIELELTKEALDLLEIDEKGLEATDRKILSTLIEKFSGGPAGVQSIAAATNEDENTIEDVFEPYLMQLGFLMRTSRGRVVTDLGYKHLGIENKNNQQDILNI